MSLEGQGSGMLLVEKRGVVVFTCDWCLQECEGLPVHLQTTGWRLSGQSLHERVCETCADVADLEKALALSLALVVRPLTDAPICVAA